MSRMALALAALWLGGAQDAAKVDNPEYGNWAGEKVGAWVRFNTVTETGGVKTESTTTLRLDEIKPERAVIDQSDESGVGGAAEVTHGIRAIPAKIKKGTDSEGSKVEVIARGTEEIEVKVAKEKCAWVETRVTGKTGPMVVKVWRSDSVVGGQAKMVMTIEKPEKKTITRTVADWNGGD